MAAADDAQFCCDCLTQHRPDQRHRRVRRLIRRLLKRR